MSRIYKVIDEVGVIHGILIPDDWVVDVTGKGYEAWAHDPSGKNGVVEYGKTEREAITKLAKRMEEWAYFNQTHPIEGLRSLKDA